MKRGRTVIVRRLKAMRIIALVAAVAALAAAGYLFAGSSGLDRRFAAVEKKVAALEAAMNRLIDSVNERMAWQGAPRVAAPRSPGQEETLPDAVSRLADVERKVGALEEARDAVRAPLETLSSEVRDLVRRVVSEEQMAAAARQEQDREANKQKVQDKAREMARTIQEKQRKKMEEWLRKFAQEEGLSIAREDAMLAAYEWAAAERERAMRDKMENEGVVFMGPDEFRKLHEARDAKVKETLSQEQFARFDKYRAQNPLPDMGFAVGIGPDAEMGADAIVIEAGMSLPKKEAGDVPGPGEK